MGKPDGGAPEKSQGMKVVLGCDTVTTWPQHHMQSFFNFAQAGPGVPQEEADDGRKSTKNQARTHTSAVEYSYQFL